MVTFVILILLILVHELGHFLAAKKFGVKVEEFGIGLPPRILTITKKDGTEYTLNWLFIGGFVRLLGEDGDLTMYEKLNPLVRKQSFIAKPIWQRAAILVAGVVMNILTGLVIFSVVYTISGVPKIESERAVVAQVVEGSPADLAGFKQGMALLTVDGEEVNTSDTFVEKVADKKGEMVTFRIASLLPDGTVSDDQLVVRAIPRVEPPPGEGALGVSIVTVPIVRYEQKPWYLAPFYGLIDGTREAYAWGREILRSIPMIFSPLLSGKLPEGAAGPVGVVREGNRIYEQGGLTGAMRFGAILSINLAVFNLLPIPGLDGGRILFLGFEKILGKKRVHKYENYIHSAGIIFLIGLLLLFTWNDIWG